ncbi:carbohydrate-binding domain-containing protein [Clostridium cellulovorans]|uniref:Dockerin type 1 n=2 Tax=Clostridium cellulovorans TaxID=1493 RepID=D9SU62_CLOC7|nr:carbohydrate-binding domain-containing protein [Clostridium cellulovorans]ADL50900.1 hypothetical protein Clocel_1144 [Clostridium cellulovorans 743B]BAV13060.1 dockerin type I cellulosome enzyme [Clostridium cellulovorans]
MNKKIITILMALSLCISATACTKQSANTTSNTQVEATSATSEASKAPVISSINISSGESETVGAADTFIELSDKSTVQGNGATVENNQITITAAGTYSIKGTLSDGQIIVNAGDSDKVYIILNGVNITSSNSAPIYVKNSKKTIISLADGTQNTVTDGAEYKFESNSTDEPNSAIYSKSDLIFIGNGALSVKANYKNGITSKDDLKIQSGKITVDAVADGVKGKDSVIIVNGELNVTAGEDGVRSSNDSDVEKGYVLIEGGKINITATLDGIQAETNALIKDGDVTISSGGGSKNAVAKSEFGMGNGGPMNQGEMPTGDMPQGDFQGERPEPPEGGFKGQRLEGEMPEGVQGQMPQDTPSDDMSKQADSSTSEDETVSAKAIKAAANIVVEGGTITIDSSDDAFHSNNNLVVNAGDINVTSGDDGLHADSTLVINGGTTEITKSYEGIESQTITINDGKINLVASDDGLNASGGNDGSSVNGRVGQNSFGSTGNGLININGGYLTLDSTGDGIDSNGAIKMTGGTAIVNGPTNDGNGPLDYDSTFDMTGGYVVLAGSLGMAQAPSTSSTQNSIKVNLSKQEANTLVRIEDESGEELLTFAPAKQYASVVVSSPNIKTGSTYKAYIGGSIDSTATYGLYSGGNYTKGTEVGSAKVSSAVTEITQEGVTVRSGGMGGRGQRK